MSDRQDSSLFPLRLIPFEEYMFVDDRPALPATGFLRLVFTGQFDRAEMDNAARIALARHPLLQAVVQSSRGGRLEWIAANRPDSIVRWLAPDQALAVSPCWQIDVRREVGVRVFLREQDGQTEMLVQVHHACCDGLGLLGFVSDLLAAYDAAWSQRPDQSPSPPPDAERLRVRGRFGLSLGGWLARLPKDLVASLAAIEYFGHRPAPLASRGEAREAAAVQPLFPTIAASELGEDETARVRQAARDLGCSVNDLLLAALFLAIYLWNHRYQPGTRKAVVRIAIPVNLRCPADARMPAANVMSIVYLDRRPHRYASPRALIRSVRREMKICKDWRLGITLIHFIRLFRALPGGLAKMLPEDRCLGTAVLSNVGELGRCLLLPEREGRLTAGNAVLQRLDVLPPVRPWTSAAFGVNAYQGRTCLAVNCDPHRFSPADAQQLLGAYARQVVALAERPDDARLDEAVP